MNYHGASRGWPAYLARLIAARGITDIVLFGDCRPMHRMARAIGAGLGVAVHVFEEGYMRPDWVTLELGGANGFSALPRDPAWYRHVAKGLPPIEDLPPGPSTLKQRARDTIAYYTSALLLNWAFPFYRTHRPWHPLIEASGWTRRLLRLSGDAARSRESLGELEGQPYFVFPLQLDSDYQLRTHSEFDSMQPALARVVASFARYAPDEVRLVVKAHPLDNGLTDWRKHAFDYARALGIERRLVYVAVGDINLMVQGAKGVATVNSTTGTLALAAGVPVITLGRAVYDVPGITHQAGLDAFWAAPERPDAELYQAFRRVLAHRCLLQGGFYSHHAPTPLAEAAAERMLSVRPDPRPVARTWRTTPADYGVLLSAE